MDFDLERVKSTLAKLDWYNSEGYRLRLPKGIHKKSSDAEIHNQIVKEFNSKKCEEMAQQFTSDFSIIKKELYKKLEKIFNKNIPTTFFVYLTNYGVGGSYKLPDKIILNINNKKGFKTIIHEIAHLIIEPWIQKYKVKHEEKERIVDLILNSRKFNFLKYNHWQENYRHVEEYIDSLFKQYFFKNPEKFFSKIDEARCLANNN